MVDSYPPRAGTLIASSITACAETEANAGSAVITPAIAVTGLGVAEAGFGVRLAWFGVAVSSLSVGVAIVATFNVASATSPVAATIFVTHQPDVFSDGGLYDRIALIEKGRCRCARRQKCAGGRKQNGSRHVFLLSIGIRAAPAALIREGPDSAFDDVDNLASLRAQNDASATNSDWCR